ncbi:hypothetical protein C0992_004567 [Termitomyces sp. T32_za158]|nr:hypothetical protein C0992_004567 [Termitomyces sp. T32_za158]
MPTHSIPLHTNAALRAKVSALQRAILNAPIRGLDPSIVIPPIRLHLTLGVMSLQPDAVPAALALLHALQPRLSANLHIALDALDILRPRRTAPDTWADVLYLAPRDSPALRHISTLVHTEFTRAGYITETRPLKLHCTVLNTSKRRPRRPFCYSDILSAPALDLLAPTRPLSPRAPVPIALGPDAVVPVHTVELWLMGSRAPDGAYVSCGAVHF